MELSKETNVERILIVFNTDGTVKGACAYDHEVMMLGAEIVMARDLPARAIEENDLSVVLPDRAKLLESISRLETQLKEAQAGIVKPNSTTVTLAQARVALRRAGLFDKVQSAVSAAGGEALDAWEYSNTVSRNSLLVKSLAAALELTDEQIDGLFKVAASIEF